MDFLKSQDLIHGGKWCEFTLTICEVLPANTVKAADGKPIKHPVLTFTNAKKAFICGETNRKLIIYAAGDADESKWVGHQIVVRACKGNWFGQKNVAALRVAPPREQDGMARPFIAAKDYGAPLTGQKIGGEIVLMDGTAEPDKTEPETEDWARPIL